MGEITLHFSRPWTLRTPVVVRHMPAQYVDAFFREGALRLSSFEAFRKHPDELRRDEAEGFVTMEIQGPNGTLSALGVNGQEAFVLCGSVRPPTGAESGSFIRINDTVRFADAVSRKIPGFVGGFEGLCVYVADTHLLKKGTRPISPPRDGEDPQKWFEEQQAYVGRHAVDGYFTKRDHFSPEAEYRFIWFAEGDPQPYIDIKCPAAKEFCDRYDILTPPQPAPPSDAA